jgi:serine/threonine-protein kinase
VTDADHPIDTTARVGFIGKRLGRFLITGELGRGGMATVYRARDPQLGRDVAIKVMHGFFAGRPELEARFRREANAVATIRHPSILNVFDFAPPAGEEPGYIVSELIEGPGLRSVLDAHGGKLPPEVAALIVARLAEALGAAHAAGIVHRDVKPDNVMIDRANGAARIVLTDFGVAHVSSLDTMTATGAVLGSPAFMSPEQARSEEVSATSDVFSLGSTLYQLCTGHLPFSGKDPLAVITGILRGHYRRPSEIEPKVGAAVEQVIVRCLQTAPAARFANGTEVARALREALAPLRETARLADEEAALARFLADGPRFEAELAPSVAHVALEEAEKARRRGHTARALAEVGRALAYVPGDPTARAMLDRIGSGARWRSRWARAATLLGLLLAAAAGSALTWRVWQRPPAARHEATRSPEAGTPAAGAAASVEAPVAGAPRPAPTPSAPPAATPRPENDAVPLTVGKAAAPPLPKTAPRPRATRGGDRPGAPRAVAPAADVARGTTSRTIATRAAAAPETANAAGATTPPAASVAHPTDEKPASPAAPPPTAPPGTTALPPSAPTPKASLTLRASYGFCEPSLDAQAPSLRANYNDLSPGRHDIYCTMPQGGPKVHVTTYDLRPGARASLVIVPGPVGRPIIGRTE